MSSQKPISVALICDFLEENWPSMDLVGDMLYQQIQTRYSEVCHVTQLRPAMRRRCSLSRHTTAKSVRFKTDRLLNRFLDYPRWLRLRAADFDVFHIVDHSYSQLVHELPPHKTIVTCHDLDTFRCLAAPSHAKRSLPFRWMTKRILAGLSKARRISCGSESVQRELAASGLIEAERTTVVLNGTHPSCTPQPDPEADLVADRLLRAENGAIFLLHVGSTIPRKRIDILLRVFAAVRDVEPAVRLLRVGGPFTPAHTQLARELGVLDSIQCLPYLDRRVLAAVYRRASLLLLTSEAEGFGLPVIEAMACGCPVVGSDIPVFQEIGSTAAVLCPVGDVAAWASTVTELLSRRRKDPSTFLQRRSAGIANAARFTWGQTAAQYLELYQQVAQAKPC